MDMYIMFRIAKSYYKLFCVILNNLYKYLLQQEWNIYIL